MLSSPATAARQGGLLQVQSSCKFSDALVAAAQAGCVRRCDCMIACTPGPPGALSQGCEQSPALGSGRVPPNSLAAYRKAITAHKSPRSFACAFSAVAPSTDGGEAACAARAQLMQRRCHIDASAGGMAAALQLRGTALAALLVLLLTAGAAHVLPHAGHHAACLLAPHPHRLDTRAALLPRDARRRRGGAASARAAATAAAAGPDHPGRPIRQHGQAELLL